MLLIIMSECFFWNLECCFKPSIRIVASVQFRCLFNSVALIVWFQGIYYNPMRTSGRPRWPPTVAAAAAEAPAPASTDAAAPASADSDVAASGWSALTQQAGRASTTVVAAIGAGIVAAGAGGASRAGSRGNRRRHRRGLAAGAGGGPGQLQVRRNR